jgi:hypothetical protein
MSQVRTNSLMFFLALICIPGQTLYLTRPQLLTHRLRLPTRRDTASFYPIHLFPVLM